ncbi:hypothetical protein H1P_330036 [Hyella patelloides LEGE 07179]|uniref:Uncharacterized protein n=1 Tax=Hyella patelloides LEGE 07179 TaxID=945734 RepID=A0A563VVG5_9CYAN|nr:hypothetical protein H1P_330036 [Hyella patelloides LEGE 07179]
MFVVKTFDERPRAAIRLLYPSHWVFIPIAFGDKGMRAVVTLFFLLSSFLFSDLFS